MREETMATGIEVGRAIRQRAAQSTRELRDALRGDVEAAPHAVATQGPPPARALEWLRRHEAAGGGIRVSSALSEGYPEVTGYLVPTLLDYGERDLAERLIHWLLCIQRRGGSYTGPYGTPYVFDSGQVLRGLLAAVEHGMGGDAALMAVQRTTDWLIGRMIDGGRAGFAGHYTGREVRVPETVHLYVLPALLATADLLNRPDYAAAVWRCFDHYLQHRDLLIADDLTCFLGYELEALIELGRAELAEPTLALLQREQRDGAVRGMGGVRWICTPGLAQLAVCWYRIGQRAPADWAMTWLDAHQEPDGGFFGSYGEGASYLEHVEIPWATKFYLDAHRLRLARSAADSVADTEALLDALPEQPIASLRPDGHLLAVGRDAGRVLSALRRRLPDIRLTITSGTIDTAVGSTENAHVLPGWIEALPLPSDTYDLVLCGRALGLASQPRSAVAEMIRVARPGGWVVALNDGQSLPLWARWPLAADLSRMLQSGCDSVTRQPASEDNGDAPVTVWLGRKRAPLGGAEWSDVLISGNAEEGLVRRVRSNHLLPWGQEILRLTSPGQKLLEVGSGTAEISLSLAQAGRQVAVMDISAENVTFAARCAHRLGVGLVGVLGDATEPLPFEEGEFDCVWTSGLLDRVSPARRRTMIAEFARVSRHRVVVMVANAACVAYRAGMAAQQQAGTWPYGLETPLLTLRDDFSAAGLEVEAEYSVGGRHALEFLPSGHPMRSAMEEWVESLSEQDLTRHNQGYLLITIGRKMDGERSC